MLAVVTQPDRPKGRGRRMVATPVKQAAAGLGLRVLQPERASAPEFCEALEDMRPELLVVVAYGQILRKNLLDVPAWGALNIHASLLPLYRGAAPIHWAILNDDPKTGLTAMRLDEGMDTGPVLLQEEAPISEDETVGELHDRLAAMSGDFIIRTLQGMAEGRLTEKAQDDSRATYTAKIDRDMARVNWDAPADKIGALIRALDPWPGAFTTLEGREVKLFAAGGAIEAQEETEPGRVAGFEEGALRVQTGEGEVLIGELQMAGRKRLSAGDFLRGVSLEEGAVLGN